MEESTTLPYDGPSDKPNEPSAKQIARNLRYHLPMCYREREGAVYFDDRPYKDLWQNEVYAKAAELATQHGVRSVLDIGCGSGYKLLKHLGHLNTCGVDVEPTLSWLKENYPDRLWREPNNHYLMYDLVVCSDVIEHVDDPDQLLAGIKSAKPKWVIISTPDRSMLKADQNGPPRNLSHIREWNFDEFRAYLSDHFDVVEHYIVNEEQCTQLAVCRLG